MRPIAMNRRDYLDVLAFLGACWAGDYSYREHAQSVVDLTLNLAELGYALSR